MKTFERLVQRHVKLILGPSHFMLPHPEGLDMNINVGAFVFVPILFRFRATHRERATGNWDHLERDIGPGNGRCVWHHELPIQFDKPTGFWASRLQTGRLG